MDYKRTIWEGYHYRFGLAGGDQADVIQSLLEQYPGSVLNVGCGPWGDKLRNLARHCARLVAVDHVLNAVRLAAKGVLPPHVGVLAADAHHLPFDDASFDHVLALELFAEIPDARRVLGELSRVCKVGGHVIVTNSVSHQRTRFQRAAQTSGLHAVDKREGYCPPRASGPRKRRYLIVFRKR